MFQKPLAKGINIATRAYHSPEFIKWKLANRGRYATQVEFLDTGMQLVYVGIMRALRGQAAGIMLEILLSYEQGITPTAIARKTFLPVNTVSGVLVRLRNAGLVARKPRQGKSVPYFCPDRDFQRVCALRWDVGIHKFFEANRHRWQDPLVDEWIEGR